MIYKFRVSRRKPRKAYLEKTPLDEQPDDEPIGLIQVQVPDSKEEWWIARALDKLGVSYTYQYPLNGGRTRGGYMIDFIVWTVPLATMIEPIGNHWHTGELGKDDLKRIADIETSMSDIARIPLVNLVELSIRSLVPWDMVTRKKRGVGAHPAKPTWA